MSAETLIVGGQLNGMTIASSVEVLWSNRPNYFRVKIRNGSRVQWVYLHRSMLRNRPNLMPILTRFVMPPDCDVLRDFDMEVIAYHWWLLGDLTRYEYARFL